MSNECIMAKETPFNTKKPKFSEMSDEAKKEYFKNLYKKRKREKKLLEKEVNEKPSDLSSLGEDNLQTQGPPRPIQPR